MRWSAESERQWHAEAEAVLSGLKDWRVQHPRATLRAIEAAVDERLNGLRARMVERLALASAAAAVRDQPTMARPSCPTCGTRLQPRGRHARNVTTHGDQTIHLEREYAVCPTCGVGLFPLDEELALLPGAYRPRLQESVVRLATWMPFARASQECAWSTGAAVSEATARRLTEAAGAAQVSLQEAATAALEQQCPAPPAGPPVQYLSADGAMVPLVGGVWAEVKTAVVGTVVADTRPDGTAPVRTQDLSYFSRLADAERFTRQALVERQQRGTATAGQVVAPMDGSSWLQGFLDYHRPDAVRVLDFAHAAEHVAAPVRAIWGEGSAATQQWLDRWLPDLKHGDPADVLEALCLLPTQAAADPTAAESMRAATVDYLAARWEQIQYATFLARGLPIGSGRVESGNKLVVEARLKGSGMHWARAHVNPLLALRTLACNDRWATGWAQIAARLRAQAADRRQRRQQVRRPLPPPALPAPSQPSPPPPPPARMTAHPPCIVNGRPTPRHPWKRPALAGGRAHNARHAKS
jgi:hypothetical protein